MYGWKLHPRGYSIKPDDCAQCKSGDKHEMRRERAAAAYTKEKNVKKSLDKFLEKGHKPKAPKKLITSTISVRASGREKRA